MLLNYALCGEVLSSLNKSFLHFAANIMNRNRQRQKPPEAFQASGGRLISKEAALLKKPDNKVMAMAPMAITAKEAAQLLLC